MNINIKSTHGKLTIETGGMDRKDDFRYYSDKFSSSIDANDDKESLHLMSMCRGIENVIKQYLIADDASGIGGK